jgi:WD40 repeat protein
VWLILVSVNCVAQTGVSSSKRPELIVETGHYSEIQSVVFSPDGRIWASGSADGTVKIWDLSTGAELRSLKADSRTVYSIAFSPDGKILGSGGFDQTVKLWDVSSGVNLRIINAREVVSSIAFSPDGKIIASGCWDATVKLWDANSGAEIRTLRGQSVMNNSVAFSPDGNILAAGSEEKTITLWDVSTGSQLHTLKGHTSAVRAVAFDPKGATLASASLDNTIKFWDVSTGSEQRTLIGNSYRIAFSRDGKVLAGGGWNYAIRLWDVATGDLLRTLKPDSAKQSIASGVDETNLQKPDGKNLANASFIMAVAFAADGKTLASGHYDNTVALWDVASGMKLRTFKQHSHPVYAVAISPDGKTLASGDYDNSVRLWDLATGAEQRTLTGHVNTVSSVAFSQDGKTLASGSYDGTIRLWDVSCGANYRTLKSRTTRHLSIVFSPDGKILASVDYRAGAGYDDTVTLWDASTGEELRTFKRRAVTSVAFSTDGKTLASGSWDATVKLWDVASGSELRDLKGHTAAVFTLAFSPDGKTLVSSSNDRTIKLWDYVTGALVRTLKGPDVRSCAFNRNGTMLVAGGYDGSVEFWNLITGTSRRIAEGHADRVNSIAITPNDKYVISGSQDSTIKIWDVGSASELATLIALDQDDWLIATPDGLFDGSPSAWKQILWRFNNDTFDHWPVESFFNEFYYPGLLTEILSGKHPQAPAEIAQKNRQQPQLTLTLANAKAGDTVASRQVSVSIDVSQAPAGAQDVRLFRNGSLVKVWRGDVLKGKTRATLDATIPIVSGENRLTAYAFNRDNVKSSDAMVIVNGAESLKRKGVLYVIAVGINEYANPDYSLRYAVADAADFADELKRQQAQLNNYEHVEVTSLKDRDATKANILKSLASIAVRIQPEDVLMIYFAGHGTAQKHHFYLIPHDLGYTGGRAEIDQNPRGMSAILAHSISDEELQRAVEGIDAGQLIMVMDACNSGQALEAEEKRRGPMNSKGLAQLAYEKGMYILTATESYQKAREPDRLGHGYLTYALVDEGLKTNVADRAPKDGQVLLREWFVYAAERVPSMQREKLDERARQSRDLGNTFAVSDDDTLQRPRVFYRREVEPAPLVVARPSMSASQTCVRFQ